MTDPFAHGTPVGDHHTWVDAGRLPCPDCSCCTVRLCERGREHAFGCQGVARAQDRETVRDCPCSSKTEAVTP